MFRNRRAKNSMPLPPGYVAVNNGHYRVPKKLTKVDVLVIAFDCTFNVLRISLKTTLMIIAVIATILSNDRRGTYTANSAKRRSGLSLEDFVNGSEYRKYKNRRNSFF